MKNIIFALPNSTGPELLNAEIVIANDAAIDDDGWALIAPFGRHPKTRVYQEGGSLKEQKFIQVLDNESADAMLGKENSFFGKLKRALVGIPVFQGHGDLKDHDPKALSNDAKIKLGVVDQIRKSARGLEAHFALDNDGASAVAAGWKLPSALWLVQPIGNEGDSILARPFKLLSVALTKFPNISGVESLANAKPTEPAATATVAAPTEPKTNNIMKQLLIGWLAAQGIALSNEATDQVVFDKFNEEMLKRSTSITALGNDKTTLTNNINTLTADRDAHKKRADDNATALANEQTARKAERKHAAEAIADLAIQRGKKTVAERDATIRALENSADFEKDSKALLEGKPVVKIAGQDNESGKALANDQTTALADYNREFAAQLPLCNQDPVKAHAAVMAKCPALADKLRPKKA